MKLPKQKIENAVGNDHRRALHHVHLNTQDRELVATDGNIMAIIPLEPDEEGSNDTTGPIPVEAIKAARKHKDAEHLTIENGTVLVPGSAMQLERPNGDGYYPDYRRVIPEAPASDQEPDIVLDASLLFKLAKALYDHPSSDNYPRGVKLYLGRDNAGRPARHKPIYVTPNGPERHARGYGVIMPQLGD